MKHALALVFSALTINACCTAKPMPVEEPTPANDMATRLDESPNGNPRVITIDMTVAQACGIDTSRTYFAFNSADTDTVDDQVAADVAACMTSGPLKGHQVVIIGFADQRGPADYNLDLGMKRAVSVGEALASHGVERTRIFVATYGEIPRGRATEADFARDRRATIRVLK